jgi:hypothetical protein
MRLVLITAVCVAALAAATGCGQSDEQQARDVVQDYVDARAEGNHERVCELYSESFKRELATGGNCEAFVEEQSSGAEPGELEIVDVRVRDDEATADLDATGESGAPIRIGLRLEREDDDWRISALQ